MRTGIYWFLEGLGFAMTKRPALLRGRAKLVGKSNIRRYGHGPELRRRLTPTYRAGCKRILVLAPTTIRPSPTRRPKLITDRITRHHPDGIVTADGTEREVDVIVFATGFHVTDSYTYVDIKGAGRRGPGGPVEPRRHRGAPRHHRRRHAQPVLPARPQHRRWGTTRWCS